MSTLTVEVTTLPNTYTNVGLQVDVWLGSLFLRNPSGQAQPPAGSPVASDTTDGSGDVSLTGLTIGTAYFVRVVDSLGYFHWFPTALEPTTLQANINMPATVTLGNPTPAGVTEITSTTLEVSNPEGPSVDIEVGPQTEHRTWPTPWGGSGGPSPGTAYQNTTGFNAYITLLFSLNFPVGGPTAGTQHIYAVDVGTTSGGTNLFQLESLEYETGFESPGQPTLRGVQFIVPPDAYFEVSLDTLTTIAGYQVIY